MEAEAHEGDDHDVEEDQEAEVGEEDGHDDEVERAEPGQRPEQASNGRRRLYLHSHQ